MSKPLDIAYFRKKAEEEYKKKEDLRNKKEIEERRKMEVTKDEVKGSN